MAQICRRLDGIPLAIELAAARLRGLSVEHLAARLDQRFRLLTGGSRTALARQQTLQATVDWSYSLLSAAEQTLFRRLAVFAGGFTLEAAEAVCAGGPIAPEEVLELLLRLVDKSLVMAEESAGDVERYRLLETLRQYGRERLLAAGEAADLYARHARRVSCAGGGGRACAVRPAAGSLDRPAGRRADEHPPGAALGARRGGRAGGAAAGWGTHVVLASERRPWAKGSSGWPSCWPCRRRRRAPRHGPGR